MLSSKIGVWVILLVLALAIGLCGCGGGDGTPVNQNTGSVSGHIEDYTAQVGIGNVSVTIGGHTALTDANGNFLVEGIPPGTYTVAIVAPEGTGLVLPSDTTITVTVIPGDTTTLPTTVFLMDENDVPPEPPTG